MRGILKPVGFLFITFIPNLNARAEVTHLKAYLESVKKNHPNLKIYDVVDEVSEKRKAIGDLELSPYFTAKASWLDDKKETAIPASQGTETKVSDYSLGVSKKFSTGTLASLTFGQQRTEIRGIVLPDPGSPTGTKGLPVGYTGVWTLGLSQSFWKNGFGRSTRLRRSRESILAEIERRSSQIQASQTLLSAEQAYWDAYYQQEELRIRKESLERAQRLLAWAKQRQASGLSNLSDLLQFQALVASREMQFVSANDEYLAQNSKVKSFIAPAPFEAIDSKDISQDSESKSYFESLKSNSSSVLRLDALLTKLESEVKQVVGLESREALRPDLSADLQLSANGRKDAWKTAFENSLNTSKATVYVGLRFSMDLDWVGQTRAKDVLEADTSFSQWKKEKANLESNTSWEELIRRYGELEKREANALGLKNIQSQKFKVEQERLRNGKSTTFQVINFEQDAADAELMLLKFQVEKRKLEAQSRLFVQEGNRS